MVAKTVRAVLGGNPPSATHRVVNAELRELLEEIQVQAALNDMLYFEDTLTQLNAVSAPAVGSTGFVLDDVGNNGVYRRGASSWTKTAELPGAFADATPAIASVETQHATRPGDAPDLWSNAATGLPEAMAPTDAADIQSGTNGRVLRITGETLRAPRWWVRLDPVRAYLVR